MSRVCLPVLAIVLILAGSSEAAGLEWPSNLLALSSGKSSQLLPLASEDSEELSESRAASAAAAAAAAQSEEKDQEEDSSSSDQLSQSSSGSSDTIDARLLSGIPVSVPLPLIVAARSGLRTVLTIQEPTVAKVGEVVQHVPTAVSHQSQTIVHDHRRLVTPIVAPAVRTTKLVRQQPPLLWTLSSADPRLVLLRN
ncbi:retinin [Drosophila pseudoobscura]|uniref:Retinin n=1 Tax=Drosophila pseudoobscura pseudoobscura TaxID=46245 RepID=A0A6I8UAV1_DROPS|nr:retinin [Drosophila pseudoobscura]